MRVVIHGGMFKTGTTSLQHLLNANRDLLSNEGIVYPFTKIGQHSYILNVRDPKWNADYLLSIAKEAEQDYASILLFSGEAVSALSYSQFKKLTACFESWPTEYVFCFRHWSTYLPSRWKQNCIRRDSQTFEEYLNLITNPSLTHFDVRYDLILSRAIASGAKNVRSISWDNAMANSGSSVPEILEALGFNKELIQKLAIDTEWLNKTSPFIKVEICRILNGLIDYKSHRKNNELFWAYAKHQECPHFHDIVRMYDKIDTEFIHIIEERLLKNGTCKVEIPNFDYLEENLFNTHGDTFVNLKNNRIFDVRSDSNQYFTQYAASWQNFTDLLDSLLFTNFEKLYNDFQSHE